MGFPHRSVGKESTCNAGDPGSIPGSGGSAAERIGYPLQYFGASLMAQLLKDPPAMWKTWVWSLGWEDPLEKGKATHSSILAWRISWTIESMGSQRVGHDCALWNHDCDFTSLNSVGGKENRNSEVQVLGEDWSWPSKLEEGVWISFGAF